jgi:hypothetical protein
VGIFTVDMLANVPFSADFSAWYMPTSILALLSVVALARVAVALSIGVGVLRDGQVLRAADLRDEAEAQVAVGRRHQALAQDRDWLRATREKLAHANDQLKRSAAAL